MVIDIGDGEMRVLYIMHSRTWKRILPQPYEDVVETARQGDFAIRSDGYLMRYEDSNMHCNPSRWWRRWLPRYKLTVYRDAKPYKMNGVWYWAIKKDDTTYATLDVQGIRKRQDKDGSWWILLELKHLAKPYQTWVSMEDAVKMRDTLNYWIDWRPEPKPGPPDPLIALKAEADILLKKETQDERNLP